MVKVGETWWNMVKHGESWLNHSKTVKEQISVRVRPKIVPGQNLYWSNFLSISKLVWKKCSLFVGVTPVCPLGHLHYTIHRKSTALQTTRKILCNIWHENYSETTALCHQFLSSKKTHIKWTSSYSSFEHEDLISFLFADDQMIRHYWEMVLLGRFCMMQSYNIMMSAGNFPITLAFANLIFYSPL